tara:strand:+ start:67 stop:651 length:585 start_codon:yes stop_codon:yes gene_type:complete
MPVCVIVLNTSFELNSLSQQLVDSNTRFQKCQLIKPSNTDKVVQLNQTKQEQAFSESNPMALNPLDFESVKLLNPKLAQKERQKLLAMWLMPFGFIAGLSFAQMTGLKTFEQLGIGGLGEELTGGIIGMLSGFIGSFAASRSISDEINQDLKKLIKENQKGNWLLILETPTGIELPWELMQQIQPLDVIRLSEL